jgi:hypothetical protein
MKHNRFAWFLRSLFLVTLLAFIGISNVAIADVGNQNRYEESDDDDDDSYSSSSTTSWDDDDDDDYTSSSSSSSGSSSGGGGKTTFGGILGFILIFAIAFFVIARGKKGKKAPNPTMDAAAAAAAAGIPSTPYVAPSQQVAEQIQAIDPAFSADKFNAWAREVFLKLQQAWTARDWKVIRPFESEELFSQHNAQLEEYIRNNKINVIEKIGIKQCNLYSFVEDGDKEVLTVRLSAVMRDYVIDATTKKVLESDPNKDWNMRYEMVFARKKGVKTQEGLSNKSTTNCPNCGAPTQITSAGQCEYCGSIITTGEHDWVLTDLHSIR